MAGRPLDTSVGAADEAVDPFAPGAASRPGHDLSAGVTGAGRAIAGRALAAYRRLAVAPWTEQARDVIGAAARGGRSDLSPTAARTLAAEATRHPGPKHVLVIGADRSVVDAVLSRLMPRDRLTVAAGSPTAAAELTDRLTADGVLARLSGTVVVTDGVPAELGEAGTGADMVLVPGMPRGDGPTVRATLDRWWTLVRPGGVLSVVSPVLAGGRTARAGAEAVAEQAAARGVGGALVVRNLPPLRVHHLRSEPADPAVAALLAPAFSPHSVRVNRRLAVDSHGVVAAGVLLGVAAVTARLAPRSKLWLLPAVAALPAAALFRDPERLLPDDGDDAVAASDGVVGSVGRVRDERFGPGEWLHVAVRPGALDVRVNRSPVAGRVVDLVPEAGPTDNEVSLYTVLDTSRGRAVIAQRGRGVERRIVHRAPIGAVLARGERLGHTGLGSRVDVYLPASARPAVTMGDRVVAGETVLAWWQ